MGENETELLTFFFCFHPCSFRQHKLEEALLFSGQFTEALQALVDWLYRVEPQLGEDQPVHGDLDLVSNLMDSHKVYTCRYGQEIIIAIL